MKGFRNVLRVEVKSLICGRNAGKVRKVQIGSGQVTSCQVILVEERGCR